MTTRILLVDDHKVMLEGLLVLFQGQKDMQVVGTATDGHSAMELVRTLAPDVVVMDIGMPLLNGIETTRRIRAEHERVRVVVLSTHADKRYVHHMLDAGASGYVLKIGAYDELVTAVRAAAVRKSYLSPEIAGMVVERSTSTHTGRPVSAFNTLGSREREVLQLVSEGRSSCEAAAAMHISVKTVETHRRNIVQKLGLHGTAQLTKYAIREGLTSVED